MISSIPPIGSSTPAGNPPDLTSLAQSFGKELDTAIAELSNLNFKNLEPQIPKIAQLLTDLETQAQKILSTAGK
jgi:hypothetical protein